MCVSLMPVSPKLHWSMPAGMQASASCLIAVLLAGLPVSTAKLSPRDVAVVQELYHLWSSRAESI
jgi:hypothetical protein